MIPLFPNGSLIARDSWRDGRWFGLVLNSKYTFNEFYYQIYWIRARKVETFVREDCLDLYHEI